MATKKETTEQIMSAIGEGTRVRAMFGEYVLYFHDKVVGTICDDCLFIKITPGTQNILENICAKQPAYEGAKDSYLIATEQLSNREMMRDVVEACLYDLK